MHCPRCGHESSSVIDSRGDGEAIRRRRQCDRCKFRYTTFERVELSLPMVVKKDGRREPFDRLKIRGGLVRACEKTQVSIEQIDRAVEHIETKIAESFAKEIPSRHVGEFVMDELRKLDQVAYIRFASVYREFSDISQFLDTLASLKSGKAKTKKKISKKK